MAKNHDNQQNTEQVADPRSLSCATAGGDTLINTSTRQSATKKLYYRVKGRYISRRASSASYGRRAQGIATEGKTKPQRVKEKLGKLLRAFRRLYTCSPAQNEVDQEMAPRRRRRHQRSPYHFDVFSPPPSNEVSSHGSPVSTQAESAPNDLNNYSPGQLHGLGISGPITTHDEDTILPATPEQIGENPIRNCRVLHLFFDDTKDQLLDANKHLSVIHGTEFPDGQLLSIAVLHIKDVEAAIRQVKRQGLSAVVVSGSHIFTHFGGLKFANLLQALEDFAWDGGILIIRGLKKEVNTGGLLTRLNINWEVMPLKQYEDRKAIWFNLNSQFDAAPTFNVDDQPPSQIGINLDRLRTFGPSIFCDSPALLVNVPMKQQIYRSDRAKYAATGSVDPHNDATPMAMTRLGHKGWVCVLGLGELMFMSESAEAEMIMALIAVFEPGRRRVKAELAEQSAMRAGLGQTAAAPQGQPDQGETREGKGKGKDNAVTEQSTMRAGTVQTAAAAQDQPDQEETHQGATRKEKEKENVAAEQSIMRSRSFHTAPGHQDHIHPLHRTAQRSSMPAGSVQTAAGQQDVHPLHSNTRQEAATDNVVAEMQAGNVQTAAAPQGQPHQAETPQGTGSSNLEDFSV